MTSDGGNVAGAFRFMSPIGLIKHNERRWILPADGAWIADARLQLFSRMASRMHQPGWYRMPDYARHDITSETVANTVRLVNLAATKPGQPCQVHGDESDVQYPTGQEPPASVLEPEPWQVLDPAGNSLGYVDGNTYYVFNYDRIVDLRWRRTGSPGGGYLLGYWRHGDVAFALAAIRLEEE